MPLIEGAIFEGARRIQCPGEGWHLESLNFETHDTVTTIWTKWITNGFTAQLTGQQTTNGVDYTWRQWTAPMTTSGSITYATNQWPWDAWVTAGIVGHAPRIQVTANQYIDTYVDPWVPWARQARAEWVEDETERRRRMAEIERQAAANRANNERFYQEAEKHALKRATAKVRAQRLLAMSLAREQLKDLDEKGFFLVEVKSGHRYRIYKGTHGNVKREEDGVLVESLCIQPTEVPAEDAMLAQKLHLEADEEDFRRTANITRLVRPGDEARLRQAIADEAQAPPHRRRRA